MSYEEPQELKASNPPALGKTSLEHATQFTMEPVIKPAIEVKSVSKRYQLFADPIDRLKQFFMPRLHHVLPFIGKAQYFQSFWSIK